MNDEYSLRFEMGIALSIFSLPLSWAIAQIAGRDLNIVTDMFMVLALVLMLEFKKPILRVRRVEVIYILYQLVIIAYALFYEKGSVISELIYNGYTVAVFMVLITQDRRKKFSNLLNCFCVLGGIVILITFIYSTDFFTVWQWSARFSLAESGDPLTLSDRILMAMIAFYLVRPENKILKVLKYAFIAMGFVGLLATGVRKTFLFIILLLIVNSYYTKKKNVLTKAGVIKFFKICVVLGVGCVVLIYISNTIPTIKLGLNKQFEQLLSRTISGVMSYAGKDTADISALTRVALRNKVVNRWFSEDGILEILFGHGYIETYVDIPIIQIFSDCGIFVGILYIYFSIFVPLKLVLSREGTGDLNIRLLKLISAPIFINQFVNGVPYGYRLWLPITFLIALVDVRSHVLGKREEK